MGNVFYSAERSDREQKTVFFTKGIDCGLLLYGRQGWKWIATQMKLERLFRARKVSCKIPNIITRGFLSPLNCI